jgi:hypothetical protein
MFGITFASPALLHGLWASLLPLLIHLLNRRRTVTVPFSNVTLLQTLQHDRMRRVKLKQVVLLILRTLVIVLICLAFARPTFRAVPAGASPGGARTSAVILLDRSLSMRYRTAEGTLFDQARRGVLEALGLLDVRDEVRLLLFDDRAEAVPAKGAARIRVRLDALQPTYRSTDLAPALDQAMGFLRSSDLLNRELYLFSDLARHGWAGLPDSLAIPDGLSVFLMPQRPARVRNAGILRAGPVEPLLTVDRPATLRIDLADYSRADDGQAGRSGEPVQVYLGQRRIAQQMVDLPAGKEASTYIRFTPEASGTVSLRVEIGEDDLSEDSVFETILNIPDALRVLLVRERPEDAYYLARGLAASAAEGWRVAVNESSPDAVTPQALSEYDLVVLTNVSRLTAGQIDAVRRRTEQGAGLLLCLGDQVDVRHYNDRLLPALFPATVASLGGAPGASSVFQATASPGDHPLFTGLRWEDVTATPAFYAYYRVVLGGGAHPVLNLRNGAPVLSEARLGAGRVMLFASGLGADLAWTDLPLKAAFAPFVNRLPQYMAAGTLGRSDYTVGQNVQREVNSSRPREALVRRPVGDAQTIWPEARGPGLVWAVGEADVPGIWEIVADERVADRFAVQIESSEPDLTPVSPDRILSLFSGAAVRTVGPTSSIAAAVAELRHGRELWRPTLGLALVLMLAETLVARTSRTAKSPESVAPG